MKIYKLLFIFSLSLFISQNSFSQNTKDFELSYDLGKMWTFENPPLEYFSKTYQFKPDTSWFKDVRTSALKFADYCSASFVSENGLVMTNHHCARQSATAVQKANEHFDQTGFYAKTISQERKVPRLFIDQLMVLEDISAQIQAYKSNNKFDNYTSQQKFTDSIVKIIVAQYATKEIWKNLIITPVSYYKGGKYSLMGYKRYDDVRLVFVPEDQAGFFGGDPDNFTYPRYNLDCAFFRVYDEKGKPLANKNYFKFSQNGPKSGEPLFVIGNPGRTDRLHTLSQLYFDRDFLLPMQITFLQNRITALESFFKSTPNDSLLNVLFTLKNAEKAYKGMLSGLTDTNVVSRKRQFEESFKTKALSKLENTNPWTDLEKTKREMSAIYKEYFVFRTHRYMSTSLNRAYKMMEYAYTLRYSKDSIALLKLKNSILSQKPISLASLDSEYLLAHIKEAKAYLRPETEYLKAIAIAEPNLSNTKIWNADFTAKLFDLSFDEILKLDDPILNLAKIAQPEWKKLSSEYDKLQEKENGIKAKLAFSLFEAFGETFPPDATFTLRIADGVMKSYEYNGTIAPEKTHFYGMYERFEAFSGKFPWSLPEKWLNPPAKLLPIPFNFISTNDIIGGNSGSAIINKNKEVVGLVFDGNIESLPGRYIYLDKSNRSVSLHSEGIKGALKYIYKANNLYKELTK